MKIFSKLLLTLLCLLVFSMEVGAKASKKNKETYNDISASVGMNDVFSRYAEQNTNPKVKKIFIETFQKYSKK